MRRRGGALRQGAGERNGKWREIYICQENNDCLVQVQTVENKPNLYTHTTLKLYNSIAYVQTSKHVGRVLQVPGGGYQ